MQNYANSKMDSLVNVNLNNQYLLQWNAFAGGLQNGMKKPVGVFWDIENCSIPRGTNIVALVSRIRDVIYKLTLIEREFVVVCDVYGANSFVINELNKLQIDIMHVSSQAKNAADEKLKQLINRFVMNQNHVGAVILLSSDINFAPVLSDLKNRCRIPVILFHHQRVSPALVACANFNVDFDELCAKSIVSYTNTVPTIDSDMIDAYLTVYNWSKSLDENEIKAQINNSSNSHGGRVIMIDFGKCEAVIYFKCKKDADRCLQRCFNNRRFHGSTLKGRIDSVDTKHHFEPIIVKNLLALSSHNACHETIKATSSNQSTSTISQLQPVLQLNQPKILINESESKELQVGNPPYCAKCIPSLSKRSIHANFLLKDDILSVHISLDKLSKQLHDLLRTHSGMILLNSLPDCWLLRFGEEFDTETQPTVMLEHLLNCTPTIQIICHETTVAYKKTIIKYLILKGDVQQDVKSSGIIQNSSYLLSSIHSLLEDTIPNQFTVFPSIKLSELENLYERKFDKKINYQSLGVSTMLEFALALKSHFNVYNYGKDYLLAYNFPQQVLRFAIDLNQVLTKLSLEWKIEDLATNFKQYSNVDLNMAVYGVCFVNDMIEALIDFDENICQNSKYYMNLMAKLKKILSNREPASVEIIKSSLKSLIPIIIKFLTTLPELNIELRCLYNKLRNEAQTKLLIEKITYEQFRISIQKYGCDNLTIIQTIGVDFISLKPNLLLIEFGQRIVTNFYNLVLLSDNSAISIYQLFYHYLEYYEVKRFNYLLFQPCSVAKLFEKMIARFFRLNAFNHFCLVYTEYDVLLCQFDHTWKEEMLIQLFFVIIESSSYKIELSKIKKGLQSKFGYSFGLSMLHEETFQRAFVIFQDKTGKYFVKLRPVYEFFSMCLTVFLLHGKIVFPNCELHECKWTLDQLSSEFYDHFGIQLCSSSDLGKTNYKMLFKELNSLFEVNPSSPMTIGLRSFDLIPLLDLQHIPKCNYCLPRISSLPTDLS